MRREEWRKKFRERRQRGRIETTWHMGRKQSRGGRRKCRRKVLTVGMTHRRGGERREATGEMTRSKERECKKE